jgi:hypothetical protein
VPGDWTAAASTRLSPGRNCCLSFPPSMGLRREGLVTSGSDGIAFVTDASRPSEELPKQLRGTARRAKNVLGGI